ncbi:MAG: hypothetical protein ACRDOX_01720 [Nocardioides sp.]
MHGRGLTAAAGCAAFAFVLLSLAGCGEDAGGQEAEDTAPSASPSTSNGAPDCAAIWQDGNELARSYDGCNSDEGFVATDTLGCSSGQRMVRYGDHFYAVLGGTIHETESPLGDDRGYRGAVASCRA